MTLLVQCRLAASFFFFIVVSLGPFRHLSFAKESVFPVLSGLEEAVEFWKQIFTRFGSNEVVFFDPMDPGKIYSVLRVPENDTGRVIIDREQARIVADYELNEDGRVRSQRGAKEQFHSGLKMAGRYLSQMQKIFREEGLPPALAYLPLVESSFNVRARSAAGAVGMWQFITDTGRKFLLINDAIDERRDPYASSRAAARLLKENYKLMGNWPLAITAYNHGTDGIFRGINTVGSRNLVEIIRRYESPTFGFASKNFYAEFLAAVEVATNSEAYFPFLRPHRPWTFREVEVKRRVLVNSLLTPTAISHNDFFQWNPALEPTTRYLPLGYRVKLPPEKLDSFVAAQRRIGDMRPANKTAARAKPGSAPSRITHPPEVRAKTPGRKTIRTAAGALRQTQPATSSAKPSSKKPVAITASAPR
jgi:membrane-bound lytic murein transglycosylase D